MLNPLFGSLGYSSKFLMCFLNYTLMIYSVYGDKISPERLRMLEESFEKLRSILKDLKGTSNIFSVSRFFPWIFRVWMKGLKKLGNAS